MNTLNNKSAPAFAAMPVDINTLADIRSVVIDLTLPVSDKKHSYLSQIKNPGLYRCGDTIIRTSHISTGVTLADRLKQYLLSGQGMTLT